MSDIWSVDGGSKMKSQLQKGTEIFFKNEIGMFKGLKIQKLFDSPSFLCNFGGKKGMCVCCRVRGISGLRSCQ